MAAPVSGTPPVTVDSGVAEPTGLSATGQVTPSAGDYPESPDTAGQNVPTIAPTPAVVTSDDAAGNFATNSQSLTDATTPVQPTNPNPSNGSGLPADDGSGDTGGDTGGGSGGSGTGTDDEGDASTGDPLYDALQAWQDQQDAQNAADAETAKQQVEDSLQTNLAANDAGFAQTIQGIQDSYGQLIDTQGSLNNIANTRSMAYGAATGSAYSAPLSYSGAVSDTEQTGITKLATLDQQRSDAIVKAQQAQESGDADLLDKAMTQVNDIESQMKSTASGIQSEVNSRVTMIKAVEAQQTTALKTQQTSAASQATIQYGDAFMNATTSAEKDSIIQSIVNSSGGLLDYGTVYSALNTYATATTKASQTATTDQELQNERSITTALDQIKLNNGGTTAPKGGTDGSYSYTPQDLTTYSSFLDQGGTAPNGTKYNGRGTDGYVDPGAYMAVYSDWISNGGTPAGFIKQYPVATNVNPASYSLLPAVLQPKGTSSTYTSD